MSYNTTYLYEDDGEVWAESSSDCSEADVLDLMSDAGAASDAYLGDVSYYEGEE